MTELERLEKAIEALEAQRGLLGDAVVDAALGPLRAELDRLKGQPSTQERRLVTVLFADLAGFTAMSERMDPEDMRDVLSAYFARWKAQIECYRGRVEKFIGDAVMAVFGLSATREDDVENAIRAALAMKEELQGLNVGWQTLGINLTMRVGIHTGVVVVTWLMDRQDGEFVAVGDTVNVASRLQSVAPPGGILVSQETFSHVRELFETEELAPRTVKGKSVPLRTRLIVRARPRTFQLGSRSPDSLDTRFVGREAELSRLKCAYVSAWDHGAHLALLSGDAGVGKSRLLLEFTHRIDHEDPGVRWLRGRAFPHTGGVPYGLLRSTFASHFCILESDSAAAAQAKFQQAVTPHFRDMPEVKAPMLGGWLGFDFESPHLASVRADPEQFRDRALGYLTELLEGMAFGSRMVIVWDDVHWGDEQSLAALRYVLRHTRGSFLVIAATRPSGPDQPPSQLCGADLPNERCTRIDLDPLSLEDTRLLALDILRSTSPVAEALLDLVVRRAEGNPYFLEEMLRMLGDPDAASSRPRATEPADLAVAIPTTLTGVLQARLDALPPVEKAALQRASVVGRVFWFSALESLHVGTDACATGETLEAALHSLVRRQLVFRNAHSTFEGTIEFIFKHALLQETTYDTVLKRDRVILHEQTAKWLEAAASRAGRSDEYAGVIAQHLGRAGAVTAASWYLRAAKHAAARFANSDALRYTVKALDLATPEDLPLRFDAHMVREDIHRVTADRPAQADDLRILKTLAESLHDQSRIAHVALRSAHHAYVTADFDVALDAADMARALGAELERAEVEGKANAIRAKVLWRRGDYPRARLAGARGLELADRASDMDLRADCLETMAHVNAHEGKYADAMHLEEEALALAKARGNVAREASALSNLGNLAWYQGDTESALKHLRLSLDLRREIGDRRGQSRVLTSIGNVENDRGELEASLGFQQASLEISRSIDDPVGTSTALSNLGDQLRMVGRFERGRACLEEALPRHHELGNRNAECIVLGNLGLICLAQGRFDEAEPYFVEGLALAHQLSAGHLVAHMSTYLGRVRLEQGDLDTAERLLREALSGGEPSIAPEATAGLALVYLSRGDLVQAGACADRIAALGDKETARADDPTWVQLARHEVMQACGQPGADALIEAAWQRIQDVAVRIEDPELRTSYLEAIKSHRVLAALREEHKSRSGQEDAGSSRAQRSCGVSAADHAAGPKPEQEESHAGLGT